ESNNGESDNTRDGGKIAGRAITTWGGGMVSYDCMTSIFESSCKGEKTCMSKRYLVKLFEESGEMLPGKITVLILVRDRCPRGNGTKGGDVAILKTKRWIVVLVSSLWVKEVESAELASPDDDTSQVGFGANMFMKGLLLTGANGFSSMRAELTRTGTAKAGEIDISIRGGSSHDLVLEALDNKQIRKDFIMSSTEIVHVISIPHNSTKVVIPESNCPDELFHEIPEPMSDMGHSIIKWRSDLIDRPYFGNGVVALSTTEAGYMALTEAVNEAIWLRGLLEELGVELNTVAVNCDNQGTIHLSRNHAFHERTKHINVRYHFTREVLEAKTVKIQR
nr:retrovirus-related Pol polyprotein from transposon TNT 1-94 [Tanacetum cinerariifolium]